MTFFEKDNIKIIHGDVIETTLIDNESVDLIITSPPYGVGIEYDEHDDAIGYAEYLNFSEHWIYKCFNLLKSTGRICINVPFETAKFGKQTVYADLINIAKEIGFKHYTTAIWTKGNVQRVSWGSMYSPKAPLLIPPAEAIIVMYKGWWGKEDCEGKVTDITKKEFIKWCDTVWAICPESAKKIGHPAPFPVELPRRCIKLLSFVGDIVLDPFMGSGSTLVAAYQNNRKALGVEISEKYCQLAKDRLMREMKIEAGRIF